MALRIELLGKPRFRVDDTDVTAKLPLKGQALLAYLLMTGEPHTRVSLAGLLWGETTEDKAKNSLRVILANLRKLFPDLFEVTHTTLAIDPAADFILDTAQFEGTIRAEAWGRLPPLYRGPFMSDTFVEGAPQFEAWQLNQRAYWDELAQESLMRGGEVLLSVRDYHGAKEMFLKTLVIEPWQEEAHRSLMLTFARLGDFNRALAQYETCRSMLLEELDVPPMPETEDLYKRIRSVRQIRPQPLPIGDLTFVGRKRELHTVGLHLLHPERRLITIVGLGGSGKTRLAIEAARQANREQALEFMNGVVFVSLAGVRSIKRLPSLIFESLGLSNAGADLNTLLTFLENKELLILLDNFEDVQDGEPVLRQILQRALGVTLLVTCRDPLELSATAWRVDLSGLAYTPQNDSHTPLSKIDEAETGPIPPAVLLFLEAARQINSAISMQGEQPENEKDREAIYRLCRLVDGNPLALRLAASWFKVVSPEEIEAQLGENLDLLSTGSRTVPERQRSMRAVLEYSWQRLTPAEQRLLSRLTLFRPDCTFGAAAAVAEADLHTLSSLVDSSLLTFVPAPQGGGAGRYRSHGLVRQYVAEQAVESAEGLDAVWRRYTAYFCQLVVDLHADFLAGRSRYGDVIEVLRPDMANVQNGWQRLLYELQTVEESDVLDHLNRLEQMMRPISWFYRRVARYMEGIEHFEAADRRLDALSRSQGGVTGDRDVAASLALIMARIKIHYGWLTYYVGEYERCERLVNTALPTIRQIGTVQDEALALHTLTLPLRRRGEYAKTRQLGEKILEMYRSVGDKPGEIQAYGALAVVAADEGDYAFAEEIGHTLSAYYQTRDDMPNFIRVRANLANTLMRAGRHQEARPLLEEGYHLATETNNYFSLVISAQNLGMVAEMMGEYGASETYYRQSLALSREIGNKRWTAVSLNGLGALYLAQKRLAQAERYVEEGLEILSAMHSEQDTLASLLLLAEIWIEQGRFRAGIALLRTIAEHAGLVEQDRTRCEALLNTVSIPADDADQSWEVKEMPSALNLDRLVDWIQQELLVLGATQQSGKKS